MLPVSLPSRLLSRGSIPGLDHRVVATLTAGDIRDSTDRDRHPRSVAHILATSSSHTHCTLYLRTMLPSKLLTNITNRLKFLRLTSFGIVVGFVCATPAVSFLRVRHRLFQVFNRPSPLWGVPTCDSNSQLLPATQDMSRTPRGVIVPAGSTASSWTGNLPIPMTSLVPALPLIADLKTNGSQALPLNIMHSSHNTHNPSGYHVDIIIP